MHGSSVVVNLHIWVASLCHGQAATTFTAATRRNTQVRKLVQR